MPAAGKYTVRHQPPKDADVVCLIRVHSSHICWLASSYGGQHGLPSVFIVHEYTLPPMLVIYVLSYDFLRL